jgi:hypothetical protein
MRLTARGRRIWTVLLTIALGSEVAAGWSSPTWTVILFVLIVFAWLGVGSEWLLGRRDDGQR